MTQPTPRSAERAGRAARVTKQSSDVTEAPRTECSFTPGPWHYRPSGDGFVIRSKEAQGPIAGINGWRPGEEAEANARLIAALPDLIAALREIEEFTCDVPDDHYLSHVCGTARTAIAKACGGDDE